MTATESDPSTPRTFRPLSESGKPAVSLVATAGKRRLILDLAAEAERLDFAAIASPSLGSTLALCLSLAHRTERIPFYTAIHGIYGSRPHEVAGVAAHIEELAPGRFSLGLGVSHEPMVRRMGVAMGRPLSDVREFVADYRAQERFTGQVPPVYLAALRDKMLATAVDVAQGALWANASLRHTGRQIGSVPGAGRDTFFLANMIPTVITDDVAAGDAVNRRTMRVYVGLPNYRNYWRECGYVEEMDAIEAALDAGDRDAVTQLMTDEWLHDCTLAGPASVVRERMEEWAALGVQPIAVMSSTSGGQATAIAELFEAYT